MASKKVFIVGGNGFARECYNNLINLAEYGKEVVFGGFLGHNGFGKSVDYKSYQHLYVGEVEEHKFKDDEYCIIGAGYPEVRKLIYDDLKNMGVRFYTLICNGVHLSPTFKYGEANVFVYPFYSTVNIEVGNCNVFNLQIVVGHDVKIGDFNFFGPSSQILGNVTIGNSNSFGANSICLPHSKIGDNNKITPLSAIYKGCKDNCYMMGNPARKIGEIERTTCVFI